MIPPSAITGTPYFLAISAHSSIADICGTPTPATIRVVQIEPGPIPTFTPSAPANISASAASAVAIFPAIISTTNVSLIFLTVSRIPLECPCAESRTKTSQPASTRAFARSY